MRLFVCLFVAGSLVSFLAQPANSPGCCMLPSNLPHKISQNNQQAIVVHSGNREDLILSINYKIELANPKTKPAPPAELAWIVTTPNEPSEYRIFEYETLQEFSSWNHRLCHMPRRSRGSCGFGCSAAPDSAKTEYDDLVMSEMVKVGPYEIQPIKARGQDAFNQLNDWLKEKGFPQEDAKHMKYFIENEFTFLCVRVSSQKGFASLKSNGQLPPLHLTFESEKPYYPLMFSSRQGVFDLMLNLVTHQPIDFDKNHSTLEQLEASDEYRRNVVIGKSDLAEKLGDFVDEHPSDNKKKYYLNVVRGVKVNSEHPITKWESDVFFVLGKPYDGKTGSMVAFLESVEMLNFCLIFLLVSAVCFYRYASRNSGSGMATRKMRNGFPVTNEIRSV